MIGSDEEQGRDLSRLVVSRAGRLVTTGDAHEPYQVVGPGGEVVEPVSVFLRDLQASRDVGGDAEVVLGGPAAVVPVTWAAGVPWDQATRAEARVILSPASGRGSDLRGCVEVTVLDAAAAVFRFFA